MRVSALAVIAVLASSSAQACSGIPGLSDVAAKLKVRPSKVSSYMALTDCVGRNYEIGALLGAAVARLEHAEKDAIELRSQIAALRAKIEREGR